MTPEPKIDRQREHQANERTFLAWLRTAIALISFGFAISRFGIFLQQLDEQLTQQPAESRPFLTSQGLGVGLVVFGVLLVILAAWRYSQVFYQIERGDYRPNRLIVWVITAIVAVLGLLSLPVLLWRDSSRGAPARERTTPSLRSFRVSPVLNPLTRFVVTRSRNGFALRANLRHTRGNSYFNEGVNLPHANPRHHSPGTG